MLPARTRRGRQLERAQDGGPRKGQPGADKGRQEESQVKWTGVVGVAASAPAAGLSRTGQTEGLLWLPRAALHVF